MALCSAPGAPENTICAPGRMLIGCSSSWNGKAEAPLHLTLSKERRTLNMELRGGAGAHVNNVAIAMRGPKHPWSRPWMAGVASNGPY